MSGLSAGPQSAIRSGLLTNGPTPFCPCKPFFCMQSISGKDMYEIWITRNANINNTMDLCNVLFACVVFNLLDVKQWKTLDEPKTRTYHGRVGAGRRAAGQRGGAGPGRTGRRRVVSPMKQLSLLPLGDRRQLSSTTLRKHEQRKSYVNRWGNTTSD